MKSSSKQPSVVFYTEALGGGIVRVLDQLIKAQTENGTKTTLAYLARSNSPSAQKVQELFPNTKIIYLGKSNILGLLRLGVHTFQILKSKDKVVIHFHSSWAGAVGRFCTVFYRDSRTFYSPHGFAFLRTDVSKIIRKMFWLIELILTRISPTVLVAYGSGEFQIARSLDNRARMVNHYLNFLSNSSAPMRSKVSKRLVISTLGRITDAKNPSRFIELSKEFNSKADFVWIGDGERLKWDFDGSDVFITGWQDDAGVDKYLRNTDIFVLLSDWEGLPFSVFDAIALNLPVVIWNFPGAYDLLMNGDAGEVCRTVTELNETINSLISSADLRIQNGLKGKAVFSHTYSYEEFIETINRIYLGNE